MKQYIVEVIVDGVIRTSLVKANSQQEVIDSLPHTVISINLLKPTNPDGEVIAVTDLK